MSGKSAKKLRRQGHKVRKEIFTEFVIQVSAMDFWPRFWFCMKMAFLMQPLQKRYKDEIEARRSFDEDGNPRVVHRSFRLTRKPKVEK